MPLASQNQLAVLFKSAIIRVNQCATEQVCGSRVDVACSEKIHQAMKINKAWPQQVEEEFEVVIQVGGMSSQNTKVTTD
jgi:hypothetical protein